MNPIMDDDVARALGYILLGGTFLVGIGLIAIGFVTVVFRMSRSSPRPDLRVTGREKEEAGADYFSATPPTGTSRPVTPIRQVWL